jgi:hypothetical protein
LLNRYWNSPALALTIERSLIRRRLYFVLVGAMSLSVFLVLSAGYGLVALAMVALSAHCLWRLYLEPLCGASVGWRRGQWLIFHDGNIIGVELRRGWVCLPWLVQMTLFEPCSGVRYSLLLFPDSMDEPAFRRLCRRLHLER